MTNWVSWPSTFRTYDCTILFKKYEEPPRMWLLGYDTHRKQPVTFVGGL